MSGDRYALISVRRTVKATTPEVATVNCDAVTIGCDCGRETTVTHTDATVTCECGAVYALTVTTLAEPGQRAGAD